MSDRTDNVGCVLSRKQSFMPMPPRSRQCVSKSPAMERSGMPAGFMATRAIRDSRPRSPATGSRTNLVFKVRTASFAPAKAGRAHGYCGRLARTKSRGLLRSSWPGGASRTIAVWPDEVSRPFCISGAHDLCPDCLASLRPTERRSGSQAWSQCFLWRNAGLERLEWSGCKAGESVACAGVTVPILGARHEHKCRLGDARGTALPHPDPLPPIRWAGEGITRTCNGGSSFNLLSEANHLPAAAGASLRVSFMPDPRVNHPPT